MYASAHRQHEYAVQIRWLARMMAVCAVALWATLVVAEFFRDTSVRWPAELFVQAGILAVVFTGYAIGWHKEVIGGWMAILLVRYFPLKLVRVQPWRCGDAPGAQMQARWGSSSQPEPISINCAFQPSVCFFRLRASQRSAFFF